MFLLLYQQTQLQKCMYLSDLGAMHFRKGGANMRSNNHSGVWEHWAIITYFTTGISIVAYIIVGELKILEANLKSEEIISLYPIFL